MSNLINMLKINPCEYGFFSSDFWNAILAFFIQLFYGLLGVIYRVFGLFADLLNIAFYIFSGVELKSQATGTNAYAIEVVSTGKRQNILDYFVLSKTMQKAYLWMALLGLLLVVVFTIYKIIKQDYFDRAGPRSKGPIFRNVAISCISFILVIPIFWVIIHVSSLLAVAVMSNLGMDVNTFAGAKIFLLSWSDNGETFVQVNNMLNGIDVTSPFTYMNNMHRNSMFTLLADGTYVQYDKDIMTALNEDPWPGEQYSLLYYNSKEGLKAVTPTFYWYIYLVGVVMAVKSLWTLVLAMIQRIFKLMGLFLVAPSPISQYVLDDGTKFKQWLSQSIQEGLRLVVACMSFAIYLIVLNAVQDINFVSAFQSAIGEDPKQVSNAINVNTNLLTYEREFVQGGFVTLADAGAAAGGNDVTMLQKVGSYIENGFYALVNAFFKILLIIGAGGAIIDLDQVLTPLISGGKSSLDAGNTGKAIDAPINAAKSVAGAMIGGAFAGAAAGISSARSLRQGRKEGQGAAQEEQKKIKEEQEKSAQNIERAQGAENADNGAEGVNGTGGPGDEANSPENANGADGQANSPENENGEGQGGNGPEGEGEGNNNSRGASGNNQGGETNNEKPTGKFKAKAKEFAGKVGKGIANAPLEAATFVGGVGRGAWYSLSSSLKAGAGAAGKALATGVFGKEAVAGFTDARKKVEADSKKRVANAHKKGEHQGYTRERKAQMKQAMDAANKKADSLNNVANNVNDVVDREQNAATALNSANMTAAKTQQVAEEAENALISADENAKGTGKNAKSRKQQMEAATKSINEAQNANAEIEEKYGTKSEMKRKIAEYEATGLAGAADKYKEQLSAYEKNESKISTNRATLDTLSSESDKRNNALRICAGNGGALSELGIKEKDLATTKYKDVLSTVETKLKATDLSEESRSRLESVKEALVEVGESTYDSAAAVTAREKNVGLGAANRVRVQAQKNYDDAHNETNKVRSNLQSAMAAYSNSVSLAAKLDESADKNPLGGMTKNQYKYSDKAGKVVKSSQGFASVNIQNKMASKARKKDLAALKDKANELNGTQTNAIRSMDGIQGINRISYADLLRSREEDNERAMRSSYVGFENQTQSDRNKNMTLITSATRALDTSTGEIALGEKIDDTTAQTIRTNATKAAAAGFSVRTTAKNPKFDANAILNSCIKNNVLDFAAIDQAKANNPDSKALHSALDKLKTNYIAQATTELGKLGTQKSTVKVGEFVDKYKTDNKYDFATMKEILDENASNGGTSSGIEKYVNSNAAIRENYLQTSSRIAASRSAVMSIGAMHEREMQYVESNTNRLRAVNRDVSALNEIISQVQTGGTITLTDAQRRLIGSAIGARGGVIRTNDSTRIETYATQARDSMRQEQVRLTRDSEAHVKQSNELKASLDAMMNSVMGNIGARTQSSVNNNVVNNNTTVNQNGNGAREPYWFNSAQRDDSQGTPVASGANASRAMSEMYDRIQAEGIKHMESMLQQMRNENRAIAQDVKSVKKTVEDISED